MNTESANCQECQNCQKSPKLKIQILPRINADQVNHENLNPDEHRFTRLKKRIGGPNEITISIRSVSSVFISGRFLFFNFGNLWQFRRFWQLLERSAAASAKAASGESAASAAAPA